MKKKLFLFIIICVIHIIVSCDLSSGSADYIKFKIDGTTVELNKGRPEDGGIPVLCRVGNLSLIIYGAKEEVPSGVPDEFADLAIWDDTEGAFSGARFEYINGSLSYVGYEFSGSLDEFSDVGEYCKGTFSGIVMDDSDNSYTISDGEFNVKRIEDSSSFGVGK